MGKVAPKEELAKLGYFWAILATFKARQSWQSWNITFLITGKVQKLPKNLDVFHGWPLIRKIISELCQLCLFYKEAKLVQKYPQLCQLCFGSELCPLLEKLYLNFANFVQPKKKPNIPKSIPNFANFANFA